MPKILIVEDDKQLAQSVAKWFQMESHLVETVNDGQQGLDRVLAGHYDVVILDIDLPGLSGLEILTQYRSQRGTMPIIMLTGKNSTAEKEQGLDAGADDYVTKPFSVKELAARVRAVLRRPAIMQSSVVQLGNLTLDQKARKICKGSEQLNLNTIDFSLLEFLMRHPGKFFSAEALIERVWQTDEPPGTDAVRSSIKRIRQAIDADGEDSLIESIKRVGYRIRD